MSRKFLPYYLVFFIAWSVLMVFFFLQMRNNLHGKRPEIYNKAPEKYLNLIDTVEYVGKKKCLECHQDQYEKYIQTGMGQSWKKVSREKSASKIDRNTFYNDQQGFYYHPFWMGNKLIVREYLIENDDTLNQLDIEAHYIVGSGQHTNSHIREINGYLFQVPFTFYTQKSLASLPPGFEAGNNGRIFRPIGFECITCHNALPEPVKGSINRYTKIPEGIDCERCHGPGEIHVAFMEKGWTVNIRKETDYTIVNPAKLSPELQMEICIRCHNQGNAVLKDGKTFFDFRPGMKVTEVYDVFREKYENDEDAFWMETHPERLKKSRCFKASYQRTDLQPMTCTSCHFTSSMRHVGVKQTPADTFISKCLNCHDKTSVASCKESPEIRESQQNNCIICHMPLTGVMDIPHVAIHDHYIRVTDKWKEEIKSTVEIQTGKFKGLKCMTCDQPDSLTLARAYYHHFEKFMSNPALLDSAKAYLENFPDTMFPADWLYLYYLKQDYSRAIKLAKYLKKYPYTEAIHWYMAGQSFQNRGMLEQARMFYRKAHNKEPFNTDYHIKLANVFLLENNFDSALYWYSAALELNPELPEALNNIGFIYLVRKEIDRAESEFQKAIHLSPRYLNAHLNMIKIELLRGDFSAAKKRLHKLINWFPGNAEVMQMKNILTGN